MKEVTAILSALEQGDPGAAQQLLPLVYEELRSVIASRAWIRYSGATLVSQGRAQPSVPSAAGTTAAVPPGAADAVFAAAQQTTSDDRAALFAPLSSSRLDALW